MKILFISAEIYPYAKRGGLGDVVGSLPKALAQLGHDVRVVFPAYQFIEDDFDNEFGFTSLPITLNVPIRDGVVRSGILKTTLADSNVVVYALAEQNMLGRPKIYGYEDDPYRFAFFSRAALDMTKALSWRPDIIHAHDWHTAPAVFWLATAGKSDPWFAGIESVYTIHNLTHQGKSDWDIIQFLDIQAERIEEENFGEINLMARGIYHAGRITTVSPNYAKEIMTWEGGAGMHKLLDYRRDHVKGILNGLDTAVWNPLVDTRLPQNYGCDSLFRKQVVRHILQDRSGLPRRENVPLIGMVSRLAWQKGIDLMGRVLHRLLRGEAGEVQFIVLGTGEEQYENMFRLFTQHYPGKMAAYLDYNEGFAPMIYGGCDMLLMPSLFEPCGLGQLIGMQYGTVPVVRSVGGLRDTVTDNVTGFTFDDYDGDSLWDAICRAINVHHDDPTHWHMMQQNGMGQDFTWDKSAQAYEALYAELL